MPRKLILHVGHAKTGTTTMQKSMQAWRPLLQEKGILHPDTGRHFNHKVLLPYLLRDGDNTKTSSQLSEARSRWQGVLQQVDEQDPHTVILSSEQLFDTWSLGQLETLKAELHRLAEDVTIVAYLREPAAFTLSVAQQAVKSRAALPMRPPNYCREILEQFQRAEIGEITARVFDRKVLAEGSIIQDFFAHFVPGFDPAQAPPQSDKNTSMSAEAMAVLQEIHRKEKRLIFGKARREVPRADQKLMGFERPQLHDAVEAALRASARDYDWLHEQFGVTFRGVEKDRMKSDEAWQYLSSLKDISEICPVDRNRKAQLWSSLSRPAAVLKRLVDPA